MLSRKFLVCLLTLFLSILVFGRSVKIVQAVTIAPGYKFTLPAWLFTSTPTPTVAPTATSTPATSNTPVPLTNTPIPPTETLTPIPLTLTSVPQPTTANIATISPHISPSGLTPTVSVSPVTKQTSQKDMLFVGIIGLFVLAFLFQNWPRIKNWLHEKTK